MTRALFIATLLVAGIVLPGWPGLAQESIEARFMTACDNAVQRNTPLYTAEQRREICVCRYDHVVADLEPAQLEALIRLFHGRGQDILDTPPAVDQARIESYEACIPY